MVEKFESSNRREFNKKIASLGGVILAFGLPIGSGCQFTRQSENSQELTAEQQKLFYQIKKIITHYELGNPVSLAKTATELVRLKPDIINSLEPLTMTNDNEVRFYAYYALRILTYPDNAQLKRIIPILKDGLSDSEINLRCSIAQTLITFGQREALPVMIQGLDVKYNKIAMEAEPPLSLPRYAALVLTIYTDQDYGDDQKSWQAWWQANENNINWDVKQKKFITESE